MEAHIQEELSACAGAIRHIRDAMDAGELEWALALTDTALGSLYRLRAEVTFPIATVREGAMSGLGVRDKHRPIMGRVFNGLLGGLMGWWVGAARGYDARRDIEHLIDTLETTRDQLQRGIHALAMIAEEHPTTTKGAIHGGDD